MGQWVGAWGGDWIGGTTTDGNPIVITALHAAGAGLSVLSPICVRAALPVAQAYGGSYTPLPRLARKTKENDEAFLLFVL